MTASERMSRGAVGHFFEHDWCSGREQSRFWRSASLFLYSCLLSPLRRTSGRSTHLGFLCCCHQTQYFVLTHHLHISGGKISKCGHRVHALRARYVPMIPVAYRYSVFEFAHRYCPSHLMAGPTVNILINTYRTLLQGQRRSVFSCNMLISYILVSPSISGLGDKFR